MDRRAKRLKEDVIAARMSLNLSQKELGEKAGFSQASVCQLESNDKNVRWLTAYKICKVLGLNLYDYFSEAVVSIGPGELKPYDAFTYKGGFANVKTSEVFSSYQEDLKDNYIFFTGKLYYDYKWISDEDIIDLVDGGRLNKGFEIRRKGLRVEGYIKSLSYQEVKNRP